ncbi:MAG: hypothetical protein NXI32_28670, partial [bacterium]|nr:hypothetical protein [bacterium]
ADKLKSREAILESILHPSRQIEEKYRSVSALTLDGQVVVGTVVQETETDLILVDANGRRHELAQDDLEAVKRLETSLMPEQLLAPLTEQQAVDLIDYLSSLKSQPAG